MTIEKSPAPASSHKPAATAGSHGAKPKAASTDSTPGAAGSGFMAILGALGDAPAEASSAPSVADLGAKDALASDVPTDLTTPSPFDASTLLQQNPQIAAAQAQQAAADAAAAAAAAASASAASVLAAATAANASASAAVQDPAAMAQAVVLSAALPLPPTQPAVVAAAPSAPTPLATPGTKPGDAASKSAAAQAASALATTAAADGQDVTASATQGLQHANARAKAGKDGLLAGAGSDTGASTASAAGSASAAVADAPNKFLAAMEQAKAQAQANPRGVEPVLAPLMARVEKDDKATGERGGLGIKSAEPTYTAASLGVGAPDASPSGAAAPALAPEMQVAEQVRYWVSNNVQNAELQLDGLGQSPVDVSIRMQGNEAHITFRSDEAATREVLQNASAHLKAMLQGEGLLLGGVSVGNSGSGNADSGERRGRQNARQVAIAPLQTASTGNTPRLRTASLGGAGRSVDLFV